MSYPNGNNPAWRPAEGDATIHSEELWLQGSFIAAVAYGGVAVLCVQCFFMLVRGLRRTMLARDGPLILFVVLMFALNTAYIGIMIQFTQQAFVDFRNFDGGPSAYEVVFFSIPLDAAANDALVITTMLADALLLWRCTIIYRNSCMHNWIPTVLATAFWVTEFILGTLFLVTLSSQSTSVFGTVNLTLGFWCFSLTLNILATILIVSRLAYYRYQLKRVMSGANAGQYTSVVAMIVESELLYTAYLILFIVPFIRNDTLVNVFVQGPAIIQSVSALMIVYRVAAGKGWTKNTYAEVTTRGTGSMLQRSKMATLRGEHSMTFEDGADKTVGSGLLVTQDMSVYASSKNGSTTTQV